MTSISTPSEPQRGEIWSVLFDPVKGDEIGKARPAVLVSDAVVVTAPGIRPLALCIVVPITTWQDHLAREPWFVDIAATKGNGLDKRSLADAFQVKNVSVTRFERRRGCLEKETLKRVVEAVALCIGYTSPTD